jgi:outer membrane protein OmpA-like peptidoglycan-associated protein
MLAGRALAEAREALEQAEAAWKEQRDVVVVEHHAYVARQRIRLAEERVALALAERALRKARVERQQALRDLRTAKAKAAAVETPRVVEEPVAAEEPASAPAPSEAGSSRSVLGAVLTRRGLVLTLRDEAFAEGEAALRPEAAPTIEALVDFLIEYPERRVRVEAFADAAGSPNQARAFSERRADAVRAALEARGIAPARIAAVGLGATYPVASNEDAEGRRQNRRVEIVISDPQGAIPDRN